MKNLFSRETTPGNVGSSSNFQGCLESMRREEVGERKELQNGADSTEVKGRTQWSGWPGTDMGYYMHSVCIHVHVCTHVQRL